MAILAGNALPTVELDKRITVVGRKSVDDCIVVAGESLKTVAGDVDGAA